MKHLQPSMDFINQNNIESTQEYKCWKWAEILIKKAGFDHEWIYDLEQNENKDQDDEKKEEN